MSLCIVFLGGMYIKVIIKPMYTNFKYCNVLRVQCFGVSDIVAMGQKVQTNGASFPPSGLESSMTCTRDLLPFFSPLKKKIVNHSRHFASVPHDVRFYSLT